MAAPTVVKPVKASALDLPVPEGAAVPFPEEEGEAEEFELPVGLEGGAELAGAVEEAAASKPVATAATAEMLRPPVGESTLGSMDDTEAGATALAAAVNLSMVFPEEGALIAPTMPNVQ